MAFPTIQTGDTKNGTVTSNSNSWTCTYPTNLASGDLILGFAAADGAADFTWPADWISTPVLGDGACRGSVAKKVSTGSESGNFTLGLSASEQGAWRIFRITGWEGTGGATFGNSGSGDGSVVLVKDAAGVTSSTPDPPSLDPVNWATEDTLWFAMCVVDTSRTISVYPLADNNTADVSGGAGGATLGLCTLNDAVSSKDPGTFTISTSDQWGAATIAIRPAAPPVETSPHRRIHHVSRLAAMDRAGSW